MNPYGPDCAHVAWAPGTQYCTFIAASQGEYDSMVAARIASLANQGQQFDGDPHACASGVGPDGYLVLAKNL